MIIKTIMAGLYEEQSYIVMDEATKEAVVLDPGGRADLIESELKTLGAKVKYILLTHGHLDHVAAVDELREALKVPVYINKDEVEYMEKDRYVFGTINKIDGYLKDGDELDFAGKKIKVISTPGHSKGGLCFLIDNKLFSGDTLVNASIGGSAFVGGELGELINSIKNKLFLLDKNVEVYPGHGPMTTIGYEMNNNPFLN